MKNSWYLLLLLSFSGCQMNVRSGNASAVAGQGQSVYSESCSVEAVQTTFSSYVKCTCNGVEVRPVYDNATNTWICRPPTTQETPTYNYGYPR